MPTDSIAFTKAALIKHADSLIFSIGMSKNYDLMLAVIDSLEEAKSLSPVGANRWRGTAYYHMGQYATSEFYFKKVADADLQSNEDLLAYNKSTRRLSELLLLKGDFEGALRVAIPAVEKMKKTGTGSDIDYAILLNNIGCCQLNLGHGEEAQESFYTARQHYINRWSTDSTGRGLQEAVIGTVYTSQAYISTHRYDESLYWIDRTEMLLNKYGDNPNARFEYFDEYQGRIEIMRAVALQMLGRKKEAKEAYLKFQNTEYSKTAPGRINANDYLLAAERFVEAANNYQYLDKALQQWRMKMTLDNIQQYLLPKMKANMGAHRRDSAIAVGLRICDALDTAIVNSKVDATVEMATIYNTQQKEAKIAQQEADIAKTAAQAAKQQTAMERHRKIGLAIALGLIVIFFSVFIFFRHRAAKRLSQAHTRLQQAYDQLEETTAVKERIESELRIARDIQMSMVPRHFPNRKGLDIHASMTAAKEVGGDLYGFQLEGDKLYFCIGDVSGKGVPASLFMAQATRLFRVLASQYLMPADIATRMNAELTEDNEQGMFVTMFIGLIDLNTCHLDFCNAGHNPPVILGFSEAGKGEMGGSFMQMEPNAPIGLWPGLDYVGEQIDDIEDHPLFIYTDGLTEAENPQQEQFGEERLLDIFKKTFFHSAKEVDEHIKDEVEKFRNGALPNDDLTMLCLKVDLTKSGWSLKNRSQS